MSTALKLHLGCGQSAMPGWLNCDHLPAPNVDCVFDVLRPWPLQDSSAADIYASHTLEHLSNHRAFFQEAWRVLHPDGKMLLRMPYGGHRSAMADPDHIRPWYPESFCWLQPGYGEAIGNLDHRACPYPFLVRQLLLRVSQRMARCLRWWALRRYARGWLGALPDMIEELWVVLTPVKDPEKWIPPVRYDPQVLYGTWCMYEHDWLKKPAPGAGGIQLVDCASLARIPIGAYR